MKRVLATAYSFTVKMLFVLKFSWFALVEEVEYLYRTIVVPSDRAFLGYVIRKRAHLLEKQIKGLYPAGQKSIGHILIAQQLERDLATWEGCGYLEDATIKWARRILGEFKSGQPCRMIGADRLRPAASHLPSDNGGILSLIKNRRSVRRWDESHLTEQEIRSLIDGARWAPSSCNRQPWHFILVQDSDLIGRIAKSSGGGYPVLMSAPLVIVILVDMRGYRLPDERFTVYQDAAAAIQNMLLVAQHLGLGACWFTFTSHSNVKRERSVRTLLHVPDHFRFGGLVGVGWPAEGVCVIPRRGLRDLVSLDRFGEVWPCAVDELRPADELRPTDV